MTLSPQPTRVATEVAHFFHANAGHAVFPLEHLVWTKVPYILGVQHPVATAFPADEQLVIQEAFFDYLWEVPLSSMVSGCVITSNTIRRSKRWRCAFF